MAQPTNFDPNEFAKWLYDGLKETIAYRLKQTFNRDKLAHQLQSKIPSQNQALHFVIRKAFEANGFKFEELKQGDATFFLLRKTIRPPEPGKTMRRLVMVPGFGDTPISWMPLYGLVGRDLVKNFDEIVVIDFPGYGGFLSHHQLVPSMKVLQGVVKTVCEANPPTVLVGYSLGGWLSAKTAQSLETPIDHLVLVAPSGLTPDEGERRQFGDFIINNKNLQLDEILDIVMHEPGKLKLLVNKDVKRFFEMPEIEQFIESVKAEDFIDTTRGFRARKLTTIWGERDQFVPSQWIRHWVEHYGSYLDAYLIKDSGHIPQIEHPLAMSQVIREALFGNHSVDEGTGWKRIQKRSKEFEMEPLRIRQSNALPEHTGADPDQR